MSRIHFLNRLILSGKEKSLRNKNKFYKKTVRYTYGGKAGGKENCSSCKHKSSKAVNSLSFIWKRQALERSNPAYLYVAQSASQKDVSQGACG